eukprot:14931767-Ditylum_brightwellii.AAC.1
MPMLPSAPWHTPNKPCPTVRYLPPAPWQTPLLSTAAPPLPLPRPPNTRICKPTISFLPTAP